MTSFFRLLFRGPSLLRLAKTGQREAFCRKLMETDVYVLDGNIGEGIPVDSTDAEFLTYTEERIRQADGASKVILFTYEDGGETYFPFFLSQKDAERFCGAYCGRENRIFAFQVLCVKGSEIVSAILAYEQTILNAQCDDETVLAPETIEKLRRLVAE